jgi:hypothetical protein
LDLDHELNINDVVLVPWLRESALFDWAYALAPTDCKSAQKHFADGVKVLLSAPPTVIEFQQAKAVAKQQWTIGIGGLPGCLPDPSTPAIP